MNYGMSCVFSVYLLCIKEANRITRGMTHNDAQHCAQLAHGLAIVQVADGTGN